MRQKIFYRAEVSMLRNVGAKTVLAGLIFLVSVIPFISKIQFFARFTNISCFYTEDELNE